MELFRGFDFLMKNYDTKSCVVQRCLDTDRMAAYLKCQQHKYLKRKYCYYWHDCTGLTCSAGSGNMISKKEVQYP